MRTSDVSVFLAIVGYLGGLGQAHDGWGNRGRSGESKSRMCPLEDNETHRCYELITENSTCIIKYLTGCGPDYSQNCRFLIVYERRPCMVYTCSHQGCCEGYVENGWGSCILEKEKQALVCENGGENTEDGGCECTEHFKGKRCEIPDCGEPCLNGGRCGIENGHPKCICPSSLHSGNFCESVSCTDSCLHGGECIQDGVLSRCKCTHGYQGDRCQYEISEKCPMVQSRSRVLCEKMGEWKNECESDIDCSNNTDTTVCCYNGCNGECRLPEFEECIYNGMMYKSGDTFSPETCKKCVCQMYGEVRCTTIKCDEKQCPDGQEPISIDDQCCKVCPGTDTYLKAPKFTNCPDIFVVLNVSENGDTAHLPRLGLQAVDKDGSNLPVSFTQTEFIHSRKPDLSKNIHIVTAYSECDPYGKRAECTFKVIVRDPFPPVFKSCPTDIYGDEDLVVSWDEPSVYDNVDIYNTEVNGDSIRNQKDVPLGTYAVTYTVWDYDMNQAACSFLVRIVEQSFYDMKHDDDDSPRFSAGSIGSLVGIVTGLFVAGGLCICFFVRVRQLHTEDDAERSQADQNTAVFSVYEPTISENASSYENVDIKLPNLPDYSPAISPPAYDQIDNPYSDKEKVVPPIYEEIASPAFPSEMYESLPENRDDRDQAGDGKNNEGYVHDENSRNNNTD
ncbi:uncharacterized protein LOC132734260 [Ruditapes philippinarum]|uniref:uncharacterized protein LOC132734260 n=1 Tax=Ruditapes philippinarum TaxID=129788 RepID=UPI00295A7BDC|nr:uncharacterized protein LOC132734260 [Ruditapes philippinarum]